MNRCSYVYLRGVKMAEKIECCEYMHAHEEIVNRVKDKMPKEESLYDLAELFKTFGDSTRIKILYVLFESEMCVCNISRLFNSLSIKRLRYSKESDSNSCKTTSDTVKV